MVSGLLLRGLIAGALAGLLAARFSFFAGEPPLERAIPFETAIHGEAGPEPQIVSRSTQRSAGLLAAHLIYGAAIGGTFSLVFALAFGRIGISGPRPLAAILALAGFIAVVLVPELKYPANPLAIGAAETIGARAALYFALHCLCLRWASRRCLRGCLCRNLDRGSTSIGGIFRFAGRHRRGSLAAGRRSAGLFPARIHWHFRIASLGARGLMECAWRGFRRDGEKLHGVRNEKATYAPLRLAG
ncbi:MAG: CbtA family protein [Methylocapsa sp.]|nr:CbtA family protein [Methylocapsa sp.]